MKMTKVALICSLISSTVLAFSTPALAETPSSIERQLKVSTIASNANADIDSLRQSYILSTPIQRDVNGILYDSRRPDQSIYIWPNHKAPGAQVSKVEEQVIERAQAGSLSDRIYLHTTSPQMAFYFPEQSNGVGLILFPGGAYARTVIDKEGEVLGPIFSKLGYTVGIVNYRMPNDGHAEGSNAPLADAQRAVRVMRSLQKELGLNLVGVMGFSAGGNVAATLETRFDEEVYPATDEKDELSARPDFVGLIYPVVSMADGVTHEQSRANLLNTDNASPELKDHYSAEKQVRDDTPPTFILHASDDADVPVNNSLLMYKALKAKNIPTEMHVFGEGGHGFGIRGVQNKPALIWPELFHNWQQSIK